VPCTLEQRASCATLKPGRALKAPPSAPVRSEVPPALRYAVRRIEALAASGHSKVGIARGLNTSTNTLARWIDEQPALQEALARGRASELLALHNVLYRAATEKGNIVAAMFLLKARSLCRDCTASSKLASVPRAQLARTGREHVSQSKLDRHARLKMPLFCRHGLPRQGYRAIGANKHYGVPGGNFHDR
jgi:hypothetical protein